MIVVDTNVVAYLYLPGELTKRAESLLKFDPQWNAPLLWRSEFRNILAAFLRRGALTFAHAVAVQREAEDLMRNAEFDVDSAKVMELVRDSGCSAYDCEFVAVASALNVKLVTMDKKLLKAFPERCSPLT